MPELPERGPGAKCARFGYAPTGVRSFCAGGKHCLSGIVVPVCGIFHIMIVRVYRARLGDGWISDLSNTVLYSKTPGIPLGNRGSFVWLAAEYARAFS
jgi:hypothetical protein